MCWEGVPLFKWNQTESTKLTVLQGCHAVIAGWVSRSQAEDRIQSFINREPSEKSCDPCVHSMGGEAGQGWVMARQALAKDASSERNFIAMEGMGLSSCRQCRGARDGVPWGLWAVELQLEQLGMGAVLTVDGTGTLPSLFSPLSFPDIPFSFLYFPSSHRRSSQLYTGTGPWRRHGVCGRGTGRQ